MEATKIKKRQEYQFVFANGKKINSKNFNIQYLNTKAMNVRIGITASKKLGNAVKRNFIKRRIKSLTRIVLTQNYTSYKDYVIVGKKGIVTEKFDNLYSELKNIIKKIEK
tara:strand:- start:570 stop:899 length:330 start_codon:yes stop_codon:yes gene_type:complete